MSSTEEKQKIYYLCRGDREGCNKAGCYLNGGPCTHTSDIRNAINFIERPGGEYREQEIAGQRKLKLALKADDSVRFDIEKVANGILTKMAKIRTSHPDASIEVELHVGD